MPGVIPPPTAHVSPSLPQHTTHQTSTANIEPGAILQRYEIDGWKDFQLDGEPVISPVDINSLPSGQYRLREG